MFGYIIYIEIYWYWSVQGGTVQHLVVQGQYNMVMFGRKWYWVSVGLLCPYILKIQRFSGMSPWWENKQTGEQGKLELLSQWTMEG